MRVLRTPRFNAQKSRTGGILVLFALILSFLLLMVAFAIDVGRMVLLRSEIQNAVDSGTLAAQLSLQKDRGSVEKAQAAAREFVRLNQVGSKLVQSESIDVEVGTWNPLTRTFQPNTSEPNSVHVFARQDKEQFSFGKVFGYTTFGAPASAIAASSGREKQDIMMVLDLSGSMAYEGRIEALRAAAPVFVTVIQAVKGDDQIGVMGLSADPSSFSPIKIGAIAKLYNSGLHPSPEHHVGVMEKPLTKNFTSLISSVLGVSNLFASKYNGWTGTGASLGDAVHYLTSGSAEARPDSKKFIVLMSDGHANRPPEDGPGYARSMAQYAASRGVKVYTISLGTMADLELMSDIASITGGKHLVAAGSGAAVLIPALTAAFKQVASEIKSTGLVK